MKLNKVSMVWLFGILVIVPIVIFIINKTAFIPKDLTKEVSNYIENSIEIKLVVPDDMSFGMKKRYTGVKQIGNRAKLKGVTFSEIFFYNSQYNKHFRIMLAANKSKAGIQLMMFTALLREKEINAKINQTEWNDPTYGTLENPVPICMLSIPKYVGWADYEEGAITDEQYRNTVYFYLSDLTDEELNERFKVIN